MTYLYFFHNCQVVLIHLFLFSFNSLQNWMAFTNLRVDNFTITGSLVFTKTNSPPDQDNYAVCQVRLEPRAFPFLSKLGYQKGNRTMEEAKIDCYHRTISAVGPQNTIICLRWFPDHTSFVVISTSSIKHIFPRVHNQKPLLFGNQTVKF